MPQCKHYRICKLDSLPGKSYCILHEDNPDKDVTDFLTRLDIHEVANPSQFQYFVFPEMISFSGETFENGMNFTGAKFYGDVHFDQCQIGSIPDLEKTANYCRFIGAKFLANASFYSANFFLEAEFDESEFRGDADFRFSQFISGCAFAGTQFLSTARFHISEFHKTVIFTASCFYGSCDFMNARFHTDEVSMNSVVFKDDLNFVKIYHDKKTIFNLNTAEFHGNTVFAQKGRIVNGFREVEREGILFENATLRLNNALIASEYFKLEDVDINNIEFRGTDFTKVILRNITWNKKNKLFKRRVLKFEDELLKSMNKNEEKLKKDWELLEQNYRDLKLNYERNHIYKEMSDFHRGEKLAWLRNPQTSRWLKLWLWGYRLTSGFSELASPPLVWFAGLVFFSAIFYLGHANMPTYWDAFEYSLKVSTFFRPDMSQLSLIGKIVYVFETVLGPLFLGFFALALRQKMKR